jgi:hypothetical protein
MSLTDYASTVELFLPMLGNLANMLGKAKAHAETKKLDPGVIEGLRSRAGHVRAAPSGATRDRLRQQHGTPRRHRGAEVPGRGTDA